MLFHNIIYVIWEENVGTVALKMSLQQEKIQIAQQ